MYNRFPVARIEGSIDNAPSSALSAAAVAVAVLAPMISEAEKTLPPSNVSVVSSSSTSMMISAIPIAVPFFPAKSGIGLSDGEKKRKVIDMSLSMGQASNSDIDNDSDREDTTTSSNGAGPTNSFEASLSAKDLMRLRNKEHARNTRKRRKQRIDVMKNTLLQLAAENEMLTRKYEDRETASMLLSILDPMVNNASVGMSKVTSKSSDQIIGEIMDAAKLAAQKQVELNSLKLKEINKGVIELKSGRRPDTNSVEASEGDDGVTTASLSNPPLMSTEQEKEQEEELDDVNNSDDGGSGSDAAGGESSRLSAGEMGSSGDISIRKQRNRIHSMNTRERRKRFYATLSSTIEELKLKNNKLQQLIYNNNSNVDVETYKPTNASEAQFENPS